MKYQLTIVLLCVSFVAFSQKEIKPTEEFIVTGHVQQELKFTLADLEKIPSKKIDDVIITNHLGEKKSTAKNMKGILLKDLLNKIEYKSESPKVLSEFYLTFIASDNYKVVYRGTRSSTVPPETTFFSSQKKKERNSVR